MLFSSTLFLFQFLPLVLLAYYALDRSLRNVVLLVASLYFYAWGEELMVWLMVLSCAVNWGFGLWVARARAVGRGRGVVVLAVVFNLGLLIAFKYADWLWTSASAAALAAGWIDQPWPRISSLWASDPFWRTALTEPSGAIRLPIGISFFTFQAFSYVIDVYRGDGHVQRNPVRFSLYIALFPQLIAGPIVRYKDVALQIDQRSVDLSDLALGVRRFVIGLGKKVLIANPAALVADKVFAMDAGEISTPLAWLGIGAYTLQIYFDFSGYSDMAVGLGRLFGFHFLENFRHPYVSRSITEFWRRWHISLSTWFRDYLYIPLGGNRAGAGRTYFNLVVVFFLCGLWHGASMTFVVWGLYHGAFLVIERLGLSAFLERRAAWIRHAYLLLAVMVGWVFFRAETLPQAWSFLGAMFGASAPAALTPVDYLVDGRTLASLVAGVIGATPWLGACVQHYLGRAPQLGALRRTWIETAGLAAVLVVLLACALELAGSTYNPFIYFRF